jgi:hypothetical protein
MLRSVILKDYGVDLGARPGLNGGFVQKVGENYTSYNIAAVLIDNFIGTRGDIRLIYSNNSGVLNITEFNVFKAQTLNRNCFPGCPSAFEGNEYLANSFLNFNVLFNNPTESTFSFYFQLFRGTVGDMELDLVGSFDPN